MWTAPKNIVKTGFSSQPHKDWQKIASIYACISYETGLPLYYRVVVGASAKDHNFLSFEEAMVFCDLNGYWVDTTNWDKPNIGLLKFYSSTTKVELENGQTATIGY